MKRLLVYITVFGLMSQVQAKNSKQIKNMQQIIDGIDDISVFAKSTFDGDNSEREIGASLFLSIPWAPIGHDDGDEIIGKYLNKTTDEKLRILIEKNRDAQGKILLNDFFDTFMYKVLKEEVGQFISVMTSCSFLTSEESKKIRNSRIFYPDDYEPNTYSWEVSYKDNKIDTLSGSFCKTIGLKGNKEHSEDDFFAMIIDFKYTCLLGEFRKMEKTIYKNIELGGYQTGPRHCMDITIAFLRKKDFNDCYNVTYTFCVSGSEETTFSEKKDTEINKEFLDSSMIDIEIAETPPSICGSFSVINNISDSFQQKLFPLCADFIIKTEHKAMALKKDVYPILH